MRTEWHGRRTRLCRLGSREEAVTGLGKTVLIYLPFEGIGALNVCFSIPIVVKKTPILFLLAVAGVWTAIRRGPVEYRFFLLFFIIQLLPFIWTNFDEPEPPGTLRLRPSRLSLSWLHAFWLDTPRDLMRHWEAGWASLDRQDKDETWPIAQLAQLGSETATRERFMPRRSASRTLGQDTVGSNSTLA